ncbi:site-specific DNA-methyltransferase [Halorutilales archaeon Cl-col2-1]
MRTQHDVFFGDSRRMRSDRDVNLVVTSPPYPMIEMWDDVFSDLNPEIRDALDDGDDRTAFSLMHRELDEVWESVDDVVSEGGVVCVNVGDATRKIGGSFERYPNHSRITRKFSEMGYEPLPTVLWRKPTNSAAKFMGSGMLPTNAYVTLEHEHILVFRKSKREFEPHSERRYESAYFWEERNDWFSDVWTDVRGESQSLDLNDGSETLRDTSAAFPFEIPYRLINMYSVYSDTVLDPFWGTGTTSLAAVVAGRNSVGYEIRRDLVESFERRLDRVEEKSDEVVGRRLGRHTDFVDETDRSLKYISENYGFEVMTKHERQIQFYSVDSVEEKTRERENEQKDRRYVADYSEFEF